VVFDCDGLLLDTESVWKSSQRRVLEALGGTFTPQLESAGHGATIEQVAADFAAECGTEYAPTLTRLTEQFESDLGDGVLAKPGAREVLEAAAARVPIACASNSWLSLLEDKLEAAGFRHLFTRIEAADTVQRGKPFPDIYEAAARRTGVEDFSQALAFEDSATGALAARRAGLRLIAVPEEGEAPPADLALTTLADPELLDWIATW
jgi:HAD superfamily hydrolase (TIGR01509 family)